MPWLAPVGQPIGPPRPPPWKGGEEIDPSIPRERQAGRPSLPSPPFQGGAGGGLTRAMATPRGVWTGRSRAPGVPEFRGKLTSPKPGPDATIERRTEPPFGDRSVGREGDSHSTGPGRPDCPPAPR